MAGEPHEDEWRSAVRVDDKESIEHTVVQGLIESFEHQIGLHRGVRTSVDDMAREHDDHERDIDKAEPSRDARDVRHAQLILTLVVNLPVHQIMRVLPARPQARAPHSHEVRWCLPVDNR